MDIEIQNVKVSFPFEPYPQQVELMTTLITAMQQVTGTFQYLKSITPLYLFFNQRTHSQLSQAIAELKNTSFKSNSRILGSREQMCINQEVLKSSSRTVLCNAKVKRGKCDHHAGSQSFSNQKSLNEKILDIEELVKYGKEISACPYFLSKDSQDLADIIFLPYNYLVDPSARKSQGIDLRNGIILFDEGHNLENSCGDASSFELSTTDIAGCIKELKICQTILNNPKTLSFYPKNFSESILQLSDILQRLLNSFLELKIGGDNSFVRNGEFIFEFFASAGITESTIKGIKSILSESIHLMSTTDGFKQSKRLSLSSLQDCWKVIFGGSLSKKVLENYKVHIQSSAAVIEEFTNGITIPKSIEEIVMGFWCFSSSVAMQSLLDEGARSIILASGTLSPLDSFASEMGVPFPHRLENTHVINQNQVFISVVPKGPAGKVLSSAFSFRDSSEYVNDLGEAILNTCKIVPEGILAFFTSYSVLIKAINDWKRAVGGTSIWDRLCQLKQPFIEPKGKSEFEDVISSYEKTIKTRGAIFFAVCRGKASEGIDFSDSKARAVIICGIPYPYAKDPKVLLKKRTLDEVSSFRGIKNAGELWYSQQALKAVNQAIGRAIRHRNDYGAILLCDERFLQPKLQRQLSRWIRPFVQRFDDFAAVQTNLSQFFASKKAIYQPKSVIKSLPTVTTVFRPRINDPLLVRSKKSPQTLDISENRPKDAPILNVEPVEPLSKCISPEDYIKVVKDKLPRLDYKKFRAALVRYRAKEMNAIELSQRLVEIFLPDKNMTYYNLLLGFRDFIGARNFLVFDKCIDRWLGRIQ